MQWFAKNWDIDKLRINALIFKELCWYEEMNTLLLGINAMCAKNQYINM